MRRKGDKKRDKKHDTDTMSERRKVASWHEAGNARLQPERADIPVFVYYDS